MNPLTVYDVIGLATCGLLFAWAVAAVWRIARGGRESVMFVLVVHFFFCGLPLMLDTVVGKPEYLRFPRLYAASRDDATTLLYCAYVALCCPLWWWTARSARREGGPRSVARATLREPPQAGRNSPPPPGWLRQATRLVAAGPLLLFPFVPDPLSALRYSANLGTALVDPTPIYQMARSSTQLSVLACAALLVFYRRLSRVTVVLVPFLLLVSVWLNGKRSIVAITLTLVGYALWEKGVLRGRRLILSGALASVFFAGFSYWYLSTVRSVDLESRGAAAYYEHLRVDFGRDDVVRMALFNERGDPSMRTLEFRGQSLLFYATAYVPRSFWPGKPWPYAVYVTAAALEVPIDYQGWGLTTSVLDEAIANLSWLGVLAGPLVIALVCRIGDRCPEAWVFLLTIMVAVLLLLVQFVAFAPLALGWAAAVFWSLRRSRAARRPERHAFAASATSR